MKKLSAFIIIVLLDKLLLMGCASRSPKPMLLFDECLDQLEKRIESSPIQTHLETLDGQKADLNEFFQLCMMNSLVCALPDKFYHWKKEVMLITSKTPNGPVAHKIRIYHNYLSTCRPDIVDPKKTHGDIAEFYNENGEFMGLAVYMGDGIYFPLPYSRYSGVGNHMRYYMNNGQISKSHLSGSITNSFEKVISAEELSIES